jgi:hypothetical protein
LNIFKLLGWREFVDYDNLNHHFSVMTLTRVMSADSDGIPRLRLYLSQRVKEKSEKEANSDVKKLRWTMPMTETAGRGGCLVCVCVCGVWREKIIFTWIGSKGEIRDDGDDVSVGWGGHKRRLAPCADNHHTKKDSNLATGV